LSNRKALRHGGENLIMQSCETRPGKRERKEEWIVKVTIDLM
jgi:hypothetical protein